MILITLITFIETRRRIVPQAYALPRFNPERSSHPRRCSNELVLLKPRAMRPRSRRRPSPRGAFKRRGLQSSTAAVLRWGESPCAALCRTAKPRRRSTVMMMPAHSREPRGNEAGLYLHTQRAKRGVSGYALLATPVIGESRRRQCVRCAIQGRKRTGWPRQAETCSHLKSFSGHRRVGQNWQGER